MPCYKKSAGKGQFGTRKALICLWLMLLLLVSAEEIGVRSEICDYSDTWDGKWCVKHGTCNKPCRAEGFDSGSCRAYILCYCCINRDG